MSQHRIGHVDGLRGLAILAVVLFHAYARWPELTSFGHSLADVSILKYGWLGVQLFFLISGFVILMTLERCTSFREFIIKRWLRLFPAMLICSALIFVSAPLFPDRPRGAPAWEDLLPGLLLVDPVTLHAVTGLSADMLEGSFWSLFVEFKFYLVFGLLFFGLGERAALAGILGLFLTWWACRAGARLLPHTDALHMAKGILDVLGASHYGWFAAGALYFKQFSTGRMAWGVGAFGVSLLADLSFGRAPGHLIAGATVCAIFATAMWSRAAQRLLQARLLLWIGFVSYPLYLLHENALIASVVTLGHALPGVPSWLLPLPPALALGALAWLVAAKLEPALRRWIVARIGGGRPADPRERPTAG